MVRARSTFATAWLGAALAGCQLAVGPGPGGTPDPGRSGSPGPTAAPGPDRTLLCAPTFARYDADGDRRWRPAEVARWLYERPLLPTYGPCPRPGEATPAPTPGKAVAQAGVASAGTGTAEPSCPLPADPASLFGRLDRDGDGRLAEAEACLLVAEQVACAQRFAAADRDHDGAVSPAEFAATYPAAPANPMAGANPPPPEVAFRALDADGDGRLGEAELCGFQRVTFGLPTAADLTGRWSFGSAFEPPAGPVFGECPPGQGLTLRQQGDRVTGEELVCGGPCFVPLPLEGTSRDGRLQLTGTMPPPADDAGRTVRYDLRYQAATGHLVGTKDGKPYWAVPYVHMPDPGSPCPL